MDITFGAGPWTCKNMSTRFDSLQLEKTNYSTKFRMNTVLKLLYIYFLKLQLLKLAAPAYIKFHQVALICKLSMFTIGFPKRKYEFPETE